MQETERVLIQVAQEVFENLAFMPPVPGEEGSSDPVAVRAAIRFSGSMNGIFWLDVPQAILPAIANNMLGNEEDAQTVTDRQTWDALGELANVICSNLISRIAGAEMIFDLEVPSVEPFQPGFEKDSAVFMRIIKSRLLLEKGSAEMTLALDGNVAL